MASQAEPTYDVFLSFTGEDTRSGFIDHLYKSLVDSGIRTFRDSSKFKLVEESISGSLLTVVEESKCSIVVLSEEYAHSRRCLDELVHITKCRDHRDRFFLPVFDHVDPSDVAFQTGPFKEAFDQHEKTMEAKAVQQWRTALSTVACIAGIDLRPYNNRHDAIKVIVTVVVERLGLLRLKYDIYQHDLPKDLSYPCSLKKSDLSRLSRLHDLPKDLSYPWSLKELDLSGHSRLHDLPKDLSCLRSLKKLDLRGHSLCSLPESVRSLKNLSILYLDRCIRLQSLSEFPENLRTLSIKYCTSLEILPQNIKSLKNLKRLYLDGCTRLQSLPGFPESLEKLSVRDCTSLEIPSTCLFLLNQSPPLLKWSLLDDIIEYGDYPSKFCLSRSLDSKDERDCFVSLNFLRRLQPVSLEVLCFLLRLGKMGIVGFSTFKPKELIQILQLEGQRIEKIQTMKEGSTSIESNFKPKELILILQLEGQRIEKIQTMKEGNASIESTTLPVDVLPCHLVELDLEDCNVSDDHPIFKSLTSPCFLEHLNLCRNLMTTLPDGITKLTKLRCLNLSRCNMLRSLPELPASLEELSLYFCGSLQKVVNLPNLFNSLRLDVRNCGSLVEIQELFMLKPVEKIDVETICKLHLFERKFAEDIDVPMFNFMTYSARKMPIQILHECGIASVFLPGKEVPFWFSYQKEGGSSIDLTVPSFVDGMTWSLNLCVVYSLSSTSKTSGLPLLMARVRNRTKGQQWTYCPTVIGVPRKNEQMLWFSCWRFTDQLVSRDQVDISLVYSAEFSVKQYGVDFVCGHNEVDIVSDTKTAVGRTLSDEDISAYKVQQPAKDGQGASYLLSNHHYPSSTDKVWLDPFLKSHPGFI